jgi:hypothetical protein
MLDWRIALSLSLLVCSACSSGEGTTSATGEMDSCPSAPKTCPADAPGYAAEVAKIISNDCASSCHTPGGDAADRLLTNLMQIQMYAGPSLTQTAACQMPPSGTPMPADDRAALLAWLVCGAKDN